MLDIILQILPVLGIILLVLLCIIIVFLLLVLFFPVSYKISGKKDAEAFSLSAGANWLFGLLRVRYAYPEPGRLTVKLLWLKLYDSGIIGDGEKSTDKEEAKDKTKEKKDKSKGKTKEKTKVMPEKQSGNHSDKVSQTTVSNIENTSNVQNTENIENKRIEENTENVDNTKIQKNIENVDITKNKESIEGVDNTKIEKNKKNEKNTKNVENTENEENIKNEKNIKNEAVTDNTEKIESTGTPHNEQPQETSVDHEEKDRQGRGFNWVYEKIEKIKFTICGTYDKIKKIWENISYYVLILQEEETHLLFNHVFKRLGGILGHIRPRKLRVNVLFGTGAPDTTGYAFGVYCMFSPMLGPGVMVTPDFERAVLEGDFDAKGTITSVVLFWHFLRVVLDKKLWRFYDKIKKSREPANKLETET